ncbi:uncharacterized protein PGTG_14619 [Puccinia graminis f. sp. tritici CRL 75-36-700-3]|uniref:Uncharacterized protein n=1 Tax=Puccinia graminis f. sp. tritici (strain CRL 75-36-700-3 / race SCCL) TaxID=418459 RepID=E3KUC9_PUCGT|nr:uncharacterized protein PGTG_14619 [Puccinia graminis f. sp. tritici CRL 75-36-700-3]EFP87904.2 hypothetical protein PGTG_14619 [Puccinia graminis f. sp. tritici CRL 75-36-700-3]
MNFPPRRNSLSGPAPRINMANLAIPAWRGQVLPPQLPPHQYYNPGTTFYQPPPAHTPAFNPGPMRHPQPSESDNLEPLEIKEPLYHHRTESQDTGPPGPEKNTPTQPTHPLEPKKPTPIHFLERTEKLSIVYSPKEGMPFTKEEYARKDLQCLVSSTIGMGGIKNPEQLRLFRIQFEAITHYLIRNGHNFHMDEFSNYLWRSLSLKLERLISDPLIWDGHLVLDGNFHIAELPPYDAILEHIYMEFEQMDFLQEEPDQPAPEIGQTDQNFHTVANMEKCDSGILSPLTQNLPPVLLSTLDAYPLMLENDLSLETLEPLDNTETKQFGSETEILPATIHSERSSPSALIEENCSPVVSVAMEFSLQIPQDGEELETLGKNENENPGPEISTCEERRPTEEDKFPSEILPEGNLPVEETPHSLVPGLPETLEEDFGEENTEEICTNNFNPVDGSALDLELEQLPTINSEALMTGKTEAPERPSSEIAQFGSPEICTQEISPSLDGHGGQSLLEDGTEKKYHKVPDINYIHDNQCSIYPSATGLTTKDFEINFQKDPGKIMEQNVTLVNINNYKQRFFPPTHQITPHQKNLGLLEPPDASQSWIKPSLITIAKTWWEQYASLKDSVKSINERIKSAIIKRNHLGCENTAYTSPQSSATNSGPIFPMNKDQVFSGFVPSLIIPGLSKVRKKIRKKRIRYSGIHPFSKYQVKDSKPVAKPDEFMSNMGTSRCILVILKIEKQGYRSTCKNTEESQDKSLVSLFRKTTDRLVAFEETCFTSLIVDHLEQEVTQRDCKNIAVGPTISSSLSRARQQLQYA